MVGRVLVLTVDLTLSSVFLPDRKNSSTTIDVVSQSDLFAFQLPPHKLQISSTVVLTNFGKRREPSLVCTTGPFGDSTITRALGSRCGTTVVVEYHRSSRN